MDILSKKKINIRKKFIFNALNNNWTIKQKSKNCYIFTKKIKKETQYYSRNFIETFIQNNLIN